MANYISPIFLDDEKVLTIKPSNSSTKADLFLTGLYLMYSKFNETTNEDDNRIVSFSYQYKKKTASTYGPESFVWDEANGNPFLSNNSFREMTVREMNRLDGTHGLIAKINKVMNLFPAIWGGNTVSTKADIPNEWKMISFYNYKIPESFDVGEEYSFKFKAKDGSNNPVSEFETTIEVTTGIRIFDWGKKSDGTIDFRFNVPVNSNCNITAPNLEAVGVMVGETGIKGCVTSGRVVSDEAEFELLSVSGVNDGSGGTVAIETNGDIKTTKSFIVKDNSENNVAYLSTSGDIFASGDISATGDIEASGNITAHGLAVVGEHYTNVMGNGDLCVNGDIYSFGDISTSEITADKVIVGGGYPSSISNNDLSVYGDIFIRGGNTFHSLANLLANLNEALPTPISGFPFHT